MEPVGLRNTTILLLLTTIYYTMLYVSFFFMEGEIEATDRDL